MTETELSAGIRSALDAIDIPTERIQSGSVRVRGGHMQLASKGTPDILTPYGMLEVKLPGESPSPEQTAWHNRWRKLGMRVGVVRSVAEGVTTVLGWRAPT